MSNEQRVTDWLNSYKGLGIMHRNVGVGDIQKMKLMKSVITQFIRLWISQDIYVRYGINERNDIQIKI